MKVYLDAGVFIDYLSGRGHAGSLLRTASRRGRTPRQLLTDAETCLTAILANHIGVTSSLTCYEVEEAMYRELARSASGLPNADRFIVPSARTLITQTLVTVDLFKIKLVELTPTIVSAQCANLELQTRGIRAADALHVTTALAEGSELLISTDSVVIALDNLFNNVSGAKLRCLDTDAAIAVL